jgi:hypothetical protein
LDFDILTVGNLDFDILTVGNLDFGILRVCNFRGGSTKAPRKKCFPAPFEFRQSARQLSPSLRNNLIDFNTYGDVVRNQDFFFFFYGPQPEKLVHF